MQNDDPQINKFISLCLNFPYREDFLHADITYQRNILHQRNIKLTNSH